VKDQRLAVRLDSDLAEALTELAAVEDRSRSAIVRALVGRYIEARAEAPEVEEDNGDG
jgi:predicted transcriptional regulator